eukprot:15438051-Alexandrium_andersonii.AAC.1
MQNRFRRSDLEPRGPKDGLKSGPRSSRGVRSAPLLAQIPNLPTKRAGRAGGASRGEYLAKSIQHPSSS